MSQYSGIRHRRILITGATSGLGFGFLSGPYNVSPKKGGCPWTSLDINAVISRASNFSLGLSPPHCSQPVPAQVRLPFERSDGFGKLLRVCRFGEMRIKAGIQRTLFNLLLSPASESNDADVRAKLCPKATAYLIAVDIRQTEIK